MANLQVHLHPLEFDYSNLDSLQSVQLCLLRFDPSVVQSPNYIRILEDAAKIWRSRRAQNSKNIKLMQVSLDFSLSNLSILSPVQLILVQHLPFATQKNMNDAELYFFRARSAALEKGYDLINIIKDDSSDFQVKEAGKEVKEAGKKLELSPLPSTTSKSPVSSTKLQPLPAAPTQQPVPAEPADKPYLSLLPPVPLTTSAKICPPPVTASRPAIASIKMQPSSSLPAKPPSQSPPPSPKSDLKSLSTPIIPTAPKTMRNDDWLPRPAPSGDSQSKIGPPPTKFANSLKPVSQIDTSSSSVNNKSPSLNVNLPPTSAKNLWCLEVTDLPSTSFNTVFKTSRHVIIYTSRVRTNNCSDGFLGFTNSIDRKWVQKYIRSPSMRMVEVDSSYPQWRTGDILDKGGNFMKSVEKELIAVEAKRKKYLQENREKDLSTNDRNKMVNSSNYSSPSTKRSHSHAYSSTSEQPPSKQMKLNSPKHSPAPTQFSPRASSTQHSPNAPRNQNMEISNHWDSQEFGSQEIKVSGPNTLFRSDTSPLPLTPTSNPVSPTLDPRKRNITLTPPRSSSGNAAVPTLRQRMNSSSTPGLGMTGTDYRMK